MDSSSNDSDYELLSVEEISDDESSDPRSSSESDSGSSSESEPEVPELHNSEQEWKNAEELNKQFRHNFEQFKSYKGVNPNFIDSLINENAGAFFDTFVDSEIIDMIVDETNAYTTKTLIERKDTPGKSRLHDWIPTDAQEIHKFLGIVMYMGVVRMPRIVDYWKTNEFYKNAFVPKIMSRNRFELLLRMIHFCSDQNETGQEQSRTHKVDQMFKKLNENFKLLYEPGRNLTVDESIVPYKGRLCIKQYIKNKTHPYGIKLFKLCSENGYTHNTIIYAGKKGQRQKNLPETIVKQLCEDYFNTGRTICTDNWYTTIPLASDLLKNKTHLVGTIRKNRKNMPHNILSTQRLRRREFTAAMNREGITIINWKDKKNVYILSTKHNLRMAVKHKNNKFFVKPKAIIYYCQGKKSVDVADQIASYSSPLRKSLKWFRKLAFDALLNIALINAYIVYKEIKKSNININDFRQHVVLHLTGFQNSEPKDAMVKTKTSHKLKKLENITSNKKDRRRCNACYAYLSQKFGREIAQNKSKKVVTVCVGCPQKPFYCLDCFNRDHKI